MLKPEEPYEDKLSFRVLSLDSSQLLFLGLVSTKSGIHVMIFSLSEVRTHAN
jgi:hypothetical protein